MTDSSIALTNIGNVIVDSIELWYGDKLLYSWRPMDFEIHETIRMDPCFIFPFLFSPTMSNQLLIEARPSSDEHDDPPNEINQSTNLFEEPIR